ncbi:MAG: hypothetical protein GF330_09085 [Candidatus Eisenbacteria bacterium]|nr:hypothetical protein [Candidatus Eisenbacteria bacterium]
MSEQWHIRISGYLDGELTPEECNAFERELQRNPNLARELEEMRAMKNITSEMKLRDLPDQVWQRYWQDTYNRMERNIGWILFSVGAIILLGAGLFALASALFQDADTPWYIRLGIGTVCAGLAVLFASVVRERLYLRKHDPYREVRQ